MAFSARLSEHDRLICGKVISDPKYSTIKNGMHKLFFRVAYDSNPEESSGPIGVCVWNEEADRNKDTIRKGDKVWVFGTLRENTFNGYTNMELHCGGFGAYNASLLVFPSLKEDNVQLPPKPAEKEKKKEADDEWSDISSVDLPF